MFEFAIVLSWIEFAARWFHVICAIAWIGSSFYFIALDLGLWRDRDLKSGADGEEWQVHGGGFYHIQKYLVAPKNLPEHLIWFKWESYMTWISGAIMLALVYWLGADLFLIDPSKLALSAPVAILISAGSLTIGWLIYDFLCKSNLGEQPTVLMVVLFVLLIAMAWGYDQIFTGRAALLHLGAFTATIMSANVFFIIIPNQKIVVADLKAGRTPAPKYGKIAKLRSTHNNYLTLPVIFLMLSTHYPLAFASSYNWLIAALVFLMGVTIRHYFNSRHARQGSPDWTWLVTVVLFIVAIWLSSLDQPKASSEEITALNAAQMRYTQADDFEAIADLVIGRCSMCHASEPVWPGIYWAPKNVSFDDASDVARYAEEIYLQAGVSRAMPPPSVNFEVIQMSDGERKMIADWYRSVNRFVAR